MLLLLLVQNGGSEHTLSFITQATTVFQTTARKQLVQTFHSRVLSNWRPSDSAGGPATSTTPADLVEALSSRGYPSEVLRVSSKWGTGDSGTLNEDDRWGGVT